MAATGTTHRTANGTGIRTARGWVWVCRLCAVTATLEGMDLDGTGFDPARWAASVDATHYCWHKDEES